MIVLLRRDIYTDIVLQILKVAATEGVHVLHLLVAVRVPFHLIVFVEEETRHGKANQHQESGGYKHNDDDRSV